MSAEARAPRRPGRLGRAIPALLIIGYKDALAYRGEFLVWMLTMTMPLIMLALFRAVAADAAAQGGTVGGFDGAAFTAYFLATLCVRQLASSWVVWEMNREIREGALAMRLLRPLHPLLGYLCDSIAAIPMRALISVPIALALLYAIDGPAGAHLVRDPLGLALFLVSLALAFLLAFALSALAGTLALYFESAIGIWHLYIGLYGLFSGYLMPLALFPSWLRRLAELTPFPYLQSLPVELLLGRIAPAAAARPMAFQLAWTSSALGILLILWRDAEKRFAAYGG